MNLLIQEVSQAAEKRRKDMEAELFVLSNVVSVLAFASEARRILEGIEEVRRHDRQVDAAISAGVHASRNWSVVQDDTLAAGMLLEHVSDRLRALATPDDDPIEKLTREVLRGRA